MVTRGGAFVDTCPNLVALSALIWTAFAGARLPQIVGIASSVHIGAMTRSVHIWLQAAARGAHQRRENRREASAAAKVQAIQRGNHARVRRPVVGPHLSIPYTVGIAALYRGLRVVPPSAP